MGNIEKCKTILLEAMSQNAQPIQDVRIAFSKLLNLSTNSTAATSHHDHLVGSSAATNTTVANDKENLPFINPSSSAKDHSAATTSPPPRQQLQSTSSSSSSASKTPTSSDPASSLSAISAPSSASSVDSDRSTSSFKSSSSSFSSTRRRFIGRKLGPPRRATGSSENEEDIILNNDDDALLINNSNHMSLRDADAILANLSLDESNNIVAAAPASTISSHHTSPINSFASSHQLKQTSLLPSSTSTSPLSQSSISSRRHDVKNGATITNSRSIDDNKDCKVGGGDFDNLLVAASLVANNNNVLTLPDPVEVTTILSKPSSFTLSTYSATVSSSGTSSITSTPTSKEFWHMVPPLLDQATTSCNINNNNYDTDDNMDIEMDEDSSNNLEIEKKRQQQPSKISTFSSSTSSSSSFARKIDTTEEHTSFFLPVALSSSSKSSSYKSTSHSVAVPSTSLAPIVQQQQQPPTPSVSATTTTTTIPSATSSSSSIQLRRPDSIGNPRPPLKKLSAAAIAHASSKVGQSSTIVKQASPPQQPPISSAISAATTTTRTTPPVAITSILSASQQHPLTTAPNVLPSNTAAAAFLANIQSSIPSDWQLNLLKKDKSITVNGITYQKIELIGKGGSSKVYKIMNEQGKIFALKKVKLAEQDDIVVEGYMNEVSLLKRLVKNERIIQLVDSESRIEDGVLLMVLEYGEIDLAHLLVKEKTGGLSPNFIRMYWEQMLRAVHAIHEEQIIHSDLKPANFMLVEGALKLIDFGIAKSIPNDTTNIHREHQTGTINYMSPEALTFVDSVSEDDKVLKLGRSSDVWSLGCILYQLVYGRPPFAHLTMVKKIQCIGDARYEIPFENITDDALLHVMRSCLQRNPKKRPTIPQLLQHPYLTGDHVGGNGGGAAAGMSEELMLRLIDQVLGSGLTRDSSDVDKRKTAKAMLFSLSITIGDRN